MPSAYRMLSSWPLLGLACVPFATHAAKLTVLDDAGTAVRSSVELSAVRFEPTSKRLVVSTRAGNIDCGTETALAAGQLGLVINDGASTRSYAVRTAPLPPNPPGQGLPAGENRQPIHYVPSQRDFQVILPSTVGTECKSNNLTDFKLRFDGGPLLSIAELVYYDVASKTLDIRINEPVLCFSYGAAGSGLKIALESPADPLVETLTGFSSVDYLLGGKVLDAISGGGTQCLDFPAAANAPAANENNPDRIFGARFELDDVEADLSISAEGLNGASTINRVASGERRFDYRVEVHNTGNGAASGVRIRELLPTGVVVEGSSSWECTRYANAGDVAGTSCGNGASGRLDADAGVVAAGEMLVYTLHRRVSGGIVGDEFRLGAAAFVNPTPVEGSRPERNFSDNADSLLVKLVANQPPVFTLPLAGSVLPIDENDATSAREIQVTFTVSDPEGDALQGTPTATVSDTTLFPASPLPVSPGASAGQWVVQLRPAAFENGTATVRLTASDGNSTPETSDPVTVTVNEVNHPPSAMLSTSLVTVTPGSTPNCTAAATTCELTVPDFLGALLPAPSGEADENGQVVKPVVDAGTFRLAPSACRPATETDPGVADFFTFGQMPQLLATGSGKYNMIFRANTAAVGSVICDIVVNDGGLDSAPMPVTIRMTAPGA